MSARGLVHHVDLTVTDLERSRAFYDAVLGFLGYERVADDADGSDWNRTGDGAFHSIGILRSRGEHADRRHDRYSAGLHHLAWTSDTREDVDLLHVGHHQGRDTLNDGRGGWGGGGKHAEWGSKAVRL